MPNPSVVKLEMSKVSRLIGNVPIVNLLEMSPFAVDDVVGYALKRSPVV
jgi:hypothetical protein